MARVKEGVRLSARRLGSVIVGRWLGEGFQGAVFEAQCGNKKYALKWFHPPDTPQPHRAYEEQREALIGGGHESGLIEHGPPDGRFLWPLDYVEDSDGHFGYLMKLRPSGYHSADELINGLVRFPRSGSYRRKISACLDLVDCFRVLHADGLLYADVNLGGAFFNFETGNALICDNDNVRPNGTHSDLASIAFAAPEVLRGENHLTIRTDEHSLAVLLYLFFVRHHPLLGARDARAQAFNQEWERVVYGKDPRFMFDPQDETNRPLPGIHDVALTNWSRLPNFFRAAFLKSFTTGLHAPNERLSDTQWGRLLSRLRDSLYECGHCSKETFYDRTTVQGGTTRLKCVWCGRNNPLPSRIRVGARNDVVMLSRYSHLYLHHFKGNSNFKRAVADIVAGPSRGNLGLRNLTDKKWTYKSEGEPPREVPPGGVLPLDSRVDVHFGGAKGLIVPRS